MNVYILYIYIDGVYCILNYTGIGPERAYCLALYAHCTWTNEKTRIVSTKKDEFNSNSSKVMLKPDDIQMPIKQSWPFCCSM